MRAADDDGSRGVVPGLQCVLVKGVDPAARQVAQVQGGASAAPDVAAVQKQLLHDSEGLVRQRFVVRRGPRHDQGVFQAVSGDAEFLSVAGAPHALDPHKTFIQIGVIHHPHHAFFLIIQRDGDTGVMIIVEVIGGSVDGVDDPCEPVADLAGFPFLRQNAALGEELEALRHHELLAFHINVRYHIGRAAFFGDAADLAVQDQSPGAFGDGRGLPRPGLLHFICDHHGPSLSRCSFFYYTSNRRERQKARGNGKGRPRAQKFIRRPAAPVPDR